MSCTAFYTECVLGDGEDEETETTKTDGALVASGGRVGPRVHVVPLWCGATVVGILNIGETAGQDQSIGTERTAPGLHTPFHAFSLQLLSLWTTLNSTRRCQHSVSQSTAETVWWRHGDMGIGDGHM